MSGESMLKGATALVTGGAKRLGAACVRVLAGEGTNVCIHYRASGEKAETLAGELRASGITAETVCGDLSDPRGVEKLFEDVVGRVGPVDILVNNASIFQDSTMLDCTVEDVLENISINRHVAVLYLPARLRSRAAGAHHQLPGHARHGLR